MSVRNPEAMPLRQFRVVLKLTNWEWWRLRRQAEDQHMPGHVLIEQVLRNFVYELPEVKDDPVPDEPPEDA